MTRATQIRHEFVHYIPERLEEGVLYVSMEYATAVHRCPCGCGEEVVTTISPTDWCLTFDGETVSLTPSIGSWSFSCRSHYWITRNRVRWAGAWSPEQIETGRRLDRIRKEQHDSGRTPVVLEPAGEMPATPSEPVKRQSFWARWFRR